MYSSPVLKSPVVLR